MSKLIVEKRYLVAFALTSTLFFAWGLASQFNDLLLHHFQKALDLTRTRASLTQFAFYIAYFCAPLPAAMIIRRLGYKKCMVIGPGHVRHRRLPVRAGGGHARLWPLPVALYIIAFGAAFLETSANPYIAIMGDPRDQFAAAELRPGFQRRRHRAGAAGGRLCDLLRRGIYPRSTRHHVAASDRCWRAREAASVGPPYLVLGILMVVIASAIALTKYPPLRAEVTPEGSGSPFAVLQKPRVRYAVIAQFFYVGAQVGTWSLLVDFAQEAANVPERIGAQVYLEATMIAFCAGRFFGAWLQRHIDPARQLMLYCGCNVVLCCLAATLGGFPSIWAHGGDQLLHVHHVSHHLRAGAREAGS